LTGNPNGRVTGVVVDAIVRVARAPVVVLGLWLATIAVSLPLTLLVRASIAAELDDSLEAGALADGADYDWMQEFNSQANGAPATLTPNVIGFAAVLDNLSAFVDRDRRPVVIAATAAGYLLLMTFLAGGAIDRLARNRATRATGFFSAAGACFPRLLRLAALSAIVYGIILGPYHAWVFQLVRQVTRDMTAERSAFLVQLGGYAAFLVPLAAAALLFDYARVRVVVEDRRSAIGAVLSAAAFIRRNAGAVLAIYAVNVLVFLVILGVYALVAPGAGGGGAGLWFGLVISQAYIAARLAAKLLFWASEAVLFEHRLAHAGYLRRRVPEWPDSPMIEALR
jgi:hypothetical protein